MDPTTPAHAFNQSSLYSALHSLPIDKSSPLTYGLILSAAILLYSTSRTGSKFPESNPKHAFELSNTRRVREFMSDSLGLLTKWEAANGKKPYKLFRETGEVLMLPPTEIESIRNDKRFEFVELASEDIHGYIPGFQALSTEPTLTKVINKYLTKALTKVTAPLSREAEIVIQQVFGDSKDWQTRNAPEAVMRVVSRMSARVFMGEDLCKDEEWIAASAEYTRLVFTAGSSLNEKPKWARQFVHWFMPVCWEVRQARVRTEQALKPHLQRREEIKAAALGRGEESPFDDSIEWFAKENSRSLPSDNQIRLSVVAIHTTSDLLCETMINIATHPELFQPLREEALRVLSAHGLKKTALHELQLMDAVFKETQRLKPIVLDWRRRACEDIVLPSGLQLKKGDKVAVSLTHMWAEDYWKEALTFDPYRFLRMRNVPNESHAANLVSTSAAHLGFGHGVHACPGRFFASNEVKIALCHLILKYDWKLPDGQRLQPVAYGMNYNTNPRSQLLFRRREEELDLSTLES